MDTKGNTVLIDSIQQAIDALRDTSREVITVDLVSVNRYAELKGWTPSKIRSKIARKIWIEGKHFFRNPDGDIEISISGAEAWSRQRPINTVGHDPTETRSGLNSAGTGNAAAPSSRRRRHRATLRQLPDFTIPSRPR